MYITEHQGDYRSLDAFRNSILLLTFGDRDTIAAVLTWLDQRTVDPADVPTWLQFMVEFDDDENVSFKIKVENHSWSPPIMPDEMRAEVLYDRDIVQ